jgi:uncharacterized membrane protein
MIRKQTGFGFQNVGLIAFCQINVAFRHYEASGSSTCILTFVLPTLQKKSPPVSLNERSYQFVAKGTITAASEYLNRHICP